MAGCAAPVDGESIGKATLPISGGFADTTDKAVVAVAHPPTSSLCSGSLIAPNLVLTARHCVSATSGAQNVDCDTSTAGQPHDAGGFLVTTADEAEVGTIGESFVSRVFVPPVEGQELLCGRDIAVLLLEDPVPADRAAPLAMRLDGPPVANEIYSAVGYGLDETGDNAGVRRRRDDLVLECVGAACAVPQVLDTEWFGEGYVCSGDSGGPAIDADGNVFGVASRGEADCGRTVYASTDQWAGWLRDVGVCASGAGLYEAPAWTAGSTAVREFCMPMGGACTANQECDAGTCIVETGFQSYCSRPCAQDSDCPDDHLCEDYNGALMCRTQHKVLVSSTPLPRDAGCAFGNSRQSSWLAALLWLMGVVATARSRGSDAARRAHPRRS